MGAAKPGMDAMKTYRGVRAGGGCVVTVDGAPLDPRLDLRRHSGAGFEWGYDGTGPRQLALAILADCLGDDMRALNGDQRFAATVIARLVGDQWSLDEGDVRRALDEGDDQVIDVPIDLATLLARARDQK